VFLANPFRLRETGLLGMNERNFFISRFNERRLYPLVDDKLKTKMLAEKHGLAVAKLFGVVREQHEVEVVEKTLEQLDSFVIKPSRGSGGKGIKVIVERRGDVWIKSNGDEVTRLDVNRHISNILSGLYSLGGKPDVAMIEALVAMDPQFEGLSYEGIPDIRIIVFCGYPVMSMMRLATHVSDGKANLHQGAVGVGLDLASGKALFAVQYNRPLTLHPDTGLPLDTLQIPHWHELMCLAASCYEITGLGYLGADIVIDRNRGPLIMELNARPGLSIQIANNTGLSPRIRRIAREARAVTRNVEERVAYSMREFSSEPTARRAV
jgi:alpha-L-glutamate ligase-like protein